MKNTIFTPIRFTAMLAIAICSASCALRSITSDYHFEDAAMKDVSLEKLGDGKVLFYNNVNFMHTLDNTGRINIWIDDKPAGQLRSGEYIIYKLATGKHQVRLLHIDMVNIRSSHEVTLTNTTKVIKVKATAASNDLTVTNSLPDDFSKFKHAPKRN